MLSAKYNMLYPPLAERIAAEKKNKKDPQKAAKTRMHQLYGAYVQGNAHKKAAALLDTRVGFDAEKILNLHASTKERMPYLQAFYEFAAKHTKNVKKILDLGCGFNPFAIPLMPDELTKNLEAYHAYDIDLRTKELINRFFAEQVDLPQTAECADLITETPTEAVDLTLMLKLVPVLEAQAPSRGYESANKTNTRFLVISYPIKSLSGREKGMEKNYSAAFENAVANGLLSNFSTTACARVGNELVYVLERV